LGLHAWNLLIVKEGDDLKVLWYEPQTDVISDSNVVEGLE